MVEYEVQDTHSRTLYEADRRVAPSRVNSIYHYLEWRSVLWNWASKYVENQPNKVLDRICEVCLQKRSLNRNWLLSSQWQHLLG